MANIGAALGRRPPGFADEYVYRCYACCSPDHLMYDCPLLPQHIRESIRQARANFSSAQGRVPHAPGKTPTKPTSPALNSAPQQPTRQSPAVTTGGTPKKTVSILQKEPCDTQAETPDQGKCPGEGHQRVALTPNSREPIYSDDLPRQPALLALAEAPEPLCEETVGDVYVLSGPAS